jgi:hypothetical protein
LKLHTAKRICFAMLALFGLLMLLMALTQNPRFGYGAIAVIALYGVFIIIFWKCPNCKKQLGPLRVKFCPHCGAKLEL